MPPISQLSASYGGVVLSNGSYANPVTVTATGTVSNTGGYGLYAAAAWTVSNLGGIYGSNAGIDLKAGGSVSNAGTIAAGTYYGSIDFRPHSGEPDNGGIGGVGVNLTAVGSVGNTGMIAGGAGGYGHIPYQLGAAAGAGGVGVDLAAGGSVSNIGTIVGGQGGVGTYGYNGAGGGAGVALAGVGSVSNIGTIAGGAGGYGGSGTAVYAGGGGGGGGGGGADLTAGGSVSNAGTIMGGQGGNGGFGIYGYRYGGSGYGFGYRDDGRIGDGGASGGLGGGGGGGGGGGAGIDLTAGGSLSNTGTVMGGNGGDGGDYASHGRAGSGGNGGAGIVLTAGGTVANTGTITGGQGGKGGYGHGTLAGTNGSAGAGIYALGAATVSNYGVISGGNSGAADAIFFNNTGANRLIDHAGAVFIGKVVAKAGGTDTIELASGATAGTLSGLGTQYVGFQTVTIDSGATWTIAGTMAGIHGSTIAGFNTNDTLDLTNLAFSSGDTVKLNSGSDVLSIYNSLGSLLSTVQLAGSFIGEFFHLTGDGGTGTDINESNVPCYCQGTLVLTDRGEVAVEDLRIGDRLINREGMARPIRWIGTRSYTGRFAAGNPDILPVRFRAGSLSDNVPKRDLWVSPLHAMFLDDVLIPARALVNGSSIVQAETVERVEYFHLELASHDVIHAEGALSESFVDDDSRGMFINAHEYRALYPNAAAKPALYCAPIVEDGELLETVRRRIAGRIVGAETPLPGRLLGQLDSVTEDRIEGWAFDEALPGNSVRLRILDNGMTIGEVVADRRRDDVSQAGIGTGYNGFSFTTPGGLSPWTAHTIEVRRALDGAALPNSPRLFGEAMAAVA